MGCGRCWEYLHNGRGQLARALGFFTVRPRGMWWCLPSTSARLQVRLSEASRTRSSTIRKSKSCAHDALSLFFGFFIPKKWVLLPSFSYLTPDMECCLTNFACCFIQDFLNISPLSTLTEYLPRGRHCADFNGANKEEKQNGCSWDTCSQLEEVESWVIYLYLTKFY